MTGIELRVDPTPSPSAGAARSSSRTASSRSLPPVGRWFSSAPTPARRPLAYSLSLFAAIVYLVATTSLLLGGRTGWRVAAAAVCVELLGVLSVGALSYAATDLFPDKTVWSHFGQGYGFLPLVLPFAGPRLAAPQPGLGR